jgi:hypothetical protein
MWFSGCAHVKRGALSGKEVGEVRAVFSDDGQIAFLVSGFATSWFAQSLRNVMRPIKSNCATEQSCKGG